jgi:hypothetical protein
VFGTERGGIAVKVLNFPSSVSLLEVQSDPVRDRVRETKLTQCPTSDSKACSSELQYRKSWY